jgi:hypothetical protein
MRRLLTSGSTDYSSALASNAGAIVWQAVPNHLSGLFLPSLQTFTIPLPSAIVKRPGSSEDTPVSALGLTSGALYVRDGWAGNGVADRQPDRATAQQEPTRAHALRQHPDLQARELAQRGRLLVRVAGEWRSKERCQAHASRQSSSPASQRELQRDCV